jgi:hypothetical protein
LAFLNEALIEVGLEGTEGEGHKERLLEEKGILKTIFKTGREKEEWKKGG